MAVARKQRGPARIAAVAQRGNRLTTLRSLRQRLARELDSLDVGASPNDVVRVSKQLAAVLAQIEALTPVRVQPVKPVKERKTALDEVERRRAARASASASTPRPNRRRGL